FKCDWSSDVCSSDLRSVEEGAAIAERLGYPLVVRPSYVLGGRGMQIVAGREELVHYLERAQALNEDHPVLIDTYLEGREVEVDAVGDGVGLYLPGVMEHIERAGVHSGDSLALFPAPHITADERDQIVAHTLAVSRALRVR